MLKCYAIYTAFASFMLPLIVQNNVIDWKLCAILQKIQKLMLLQYPNKQLEYIFFTLHCLPFTKNQSFTQNSRCRGMSMRVRIHRPNRNGESNLSNRRPRSNFFKKCITSKRLEIVELQLYSTLYIYLYVLLLFFYFSSLFLLLLEMFCFCFWSSLETRQSVRWMKKTSNHRIH